MVKRVVAYRQVIETVMYLGNHLMSLVVDNDVTKITNSIINLKKTGVDDHITTPQISDLN